MIVFKPVNRAQTLLIQLSPARERRNFPRRSTTTNEAVQLNRILYYISVAVFSMLISRCAQADVQFDSIKLEDNQPFMTEIPKLRDKSLVCDVTSIYWASLAQMKIRGTGIYRVNGDQPTLYQVVARDPFGREIVAHDGNAPLRFAQLGQGSEPRRFDFEIHMNDLCLANKDKQFAPDEFLTYVQSLRIAVAPLHSSR